MWNSSIANSRHICTPNTRKASGEFFASFWKPDARGRRSLRGVIRLLDDKPRPEHQAPNGIEQRWPTEAPPTLERSLADHQEHPRACPDTSTRLAHDAADQKPFHVSSKEPSFGPNFGQESSQRGARNTRQKPVRASEST